MSMLIIIVVITIAVALLFDVVNGFHDAANSIATVVATRVLAPKWAVLWAAFFNFIAMFVFAPKVASTMSKIVYIDPSDKAFVYVVLAGVIGAIVWDLVTWWFGLPTSSSHALIGGFAGAGIAYQGLDVINWRKLEEAMAFIPLAPLIGYAVAVVVMLAVYWIFRNWYPGKVDKVFRKGQLLSAALYSLGHGGNDAQKTMGIILAVLIAGGIFDKNVELSLLSSKTSWIIISCHIAMAIGTALGGWRIVKTMGMKLSKLKPVQGFCAETAGAMTIFFATNLGIPVSTTHTIAGSIVGVGMVTKSAGIKWNIAFRIIAAWFITIPFSAGMGAICFWLMH